MLLYYTKNLGIFFSTKSSVKGLASEKALRRSIVGMPLPVYNTVIKGEKYRDGRR